MSVSIAPLTRRSFLRGKAGSTIGAELESLPARSSHARSKLPSGIRLPNKEVLTEAG